MISASRRRCSSVGEIQIGRSSSAGSKRSMLARKTRTPRASSALTWPFSWRPKRPARPANLTDLGRREHAFDLAVEFLDRCEDQTANRQIEPEPDRVRRDEHVRRAAAKTLRLAPPHRG